MHEDDIKIILECIQDLKVEMKEEISGVKSELTKTMDSKISGLKSEIFTYLENDTHKRIDLIADGLQGLNVKVDTLDAKADTLMAYSDDINALKTRLKYHESEIEKIKKLLNVS